MNISHSRNPKVTILIPVYNEQHHLPACLDCIIKQTYNPELIEVILLNGGSTDETFSVASEYQNRYTRIQIVQFPRLNIPQLLNAGAMRANGEVLVRVDARSRPSPNYVKDLVFFLIETGAFHVGGKIKPINDGYLGNIISVALSHLFGVGNSPHRTSDQPTHKEGGYLGAFWKNTFLSAGGYDPDCAYTEDDELDFRMIRLGEKIIYRPEIEVPYICRDTLTGLWVQFFRYGQYKLIVLHKHNSLPSMRPYIPLALVGGSLSLLLLSLFHYYFFSAFLVIMLTYFGLNIALSVLIAIQKRDLSLLGLPVVFCVLHFSYGTGELFGLKKLLTNWLRRVMA